MERASIAALVHEFYRCRLANDVDACLAFFAPNATLRVAGSPEASPIAGGTSDPESLPRLARSLVETWPWRAMDTESVIIDGNRAAVHYRVEAVFAPTGDTVTTEVMDLLSVKDDRIDSYVQFADTALVAELAADAGA